ncbi:MAG: hypothetical protein ACXABY_21065 [Candidatus Thorarchaeota archaeon]|jgi:hypothetical protein
MAEILAAMLPNAKPGAKRDDSDKVGLLGLQFLLVDDDPTGGDGVAAPIGSLASWDDSGTGKLYLKTGAADTAWTLK